MFDRDVTLPPDNVVGALEVISTHLKCSAFMDGKKLLLTPEIFEDYLPEYDIRPCCGSPMGSEAAPVGGWNLSRWIRCHERILR